jgi:hypothetical protein
MILAPLAASPGSRRSLRDNTTPSCLIVEMRVGTRTNEHEHSLPPASGAIPRKIQRKAVRCDRNGFRQTPSRDRIPLFRAMSVVSSIAAGRFRKCCKLNAQIEAMCHALVWCSESVISQIFCQIFCVTITGCQISDKALRSMQLLLHSDRGVNPLHSIAPTTQ